MLQVVMVALGGAMGSVLRYLVAGWVQPAGGGFPLGTLVVNILGCFALGVLNALFGGSGPWLIRPEYRIGLTIGVLGGFTTFSTFGWESFQLAKDQQHLRAGLNLLLSIALGLVAVWLGYRLAQRWVGG